jgi:hypothetical protein
MKTSDNKSGKTAEQPNKQEWYDAAKAALFHAKRLDALQGKYAERYNQLALAGDTESEEYELLEAINEFDFDTVIFTLGDAYEAELP